MKIIDKNIKDGRLTVRFMGIKLFTHKLNRSGKKNIFVLIKQDGTKVYNPKIKGLTVRFRGGYNVVKLYEPITHALNNVNLNLKNKDKIEIKQTKNVIQSLSVQCFGHSKVFIDEDFSIGSGGFIADYGSKISIGKDCMFSANIIMQTSDSHIIYDGNSKKFIGTNDIVIGNHVWVGFGCKILKKSIIPDNCIVGMDSIVTKQFTDKNSVIVGCPAKVVKTNMFWDRKHYNEMKEEKAESVYLEKFNNI